MKEQDSSPTQSVIVEKLQQLISGDISRSDAANWAHPWATSKADEVTSLSSLRTLESLAMADLPSTDRDYLYGNKDFEKWLEQLQSEHPTRRG